MLKKANTRLFFLKRLRRTKVPPKDIVSSFLEITRPILQYACQVWHAGLTKDEHDGLEKVQERAVRVAYPSMAYDGALSETDITSLEHRHSDLCKRLLSDMHSESQMLHSLTTAKRKSNQFKQCCNKNICERFAMLFQLKINPTLLKHYTVVVFL